MDLITSKKKTIPHFCAACAAITQHAIRLDHNEEFVLECSSGDGCDRFLKYPKDHVFEEPTDAV